MGSGRRVTGRKWGVATSDERWFAGGSFCHQVAEDVEVIPLVGVQVLDPRAERVDHRDGAVVVFLRPDRAERGPSDQFEVGGRNDVSGHR
jgi:hypothetical protein